MKGIYVERIVEIIENYLNWEDREEREEYLQELYAARDDLKPNATIGELLYHRIYEAYEQYKKGNLSLEDKVDVVHGILGHDRYRRIYYIRSVNAIFSRGIDYPVKSSSAEAVNLFSSYHLQWDDFNAANRGEVMGTDKESKDYEVLHDKIERYVLNEYYRMQEFQNIMKDDIQRNIEIEPDIMKNFVDPSSKDYVYKNLCGDDVYSLLNIRCSREVFNKLREGSYEKDEDVLEFLGDISIKVDDIIRELYWDIHHTCYTYYDKFKKCREGKESNVEVLDWYNRCIALGLDYEKMYDKLSLDDFMIGNDMEIEIINHRDIYKAFGIDIDKYMDQEIER